MKSSVDTHKRTPRATKVLEMYMFPFAITSVQIATVHATEWRTGKLAHQFQYAILTHHSCCILFLPPGDINSKCGTTKSTRTGISQIIIHLYQCHRHTGVFQNPVSIMVK